MDGTGVARRLLGGLMLAVLTGVGAWLLMSQVTTPSWLIDLMPHPPWGPALAHGGDTDRRPMPPRPFSIADASAVPGLPPDSGGLYPGGTQLRWVRLANPNSVDILVTEVAAEVQPPLRNGLIVDGCPAASLSVAPLSSSVLVRRHATADVALSARLSPDAPDACKNVYFPLTYSGTASQP